MIGQRAERKLFFCINKSELGPLSLSSFILFFFISVDTMKFFKTVHIFDYPWTLVSAAQWQKYPNDHCPHVQHVDVLNRTVDPETGILTTERLITVKQNVPRLILKVLIL
jgi:hypothetical protein